MKTEPVLDLRAETCPYTFVKTRLCLEEMAVGEILIVVLGNAESAASVPRSLARAGQDVLEVVEEAGPVWRVRVRKAREEWGPR